MRRIVVSLLKGGVAKSETAVNLAHGLVLSGHRVLLVDTDVQSHCAEMLGLDPERGLADLIAGWAGPAEALVKARDDLWLLAGGNKLAAVKMEIARREMAPEAVLDEALKSFEGRFDFMIMDTAPGWDTLLVNALYCSQEILSPVSMEPMALSGLIRFEERLQVIQKYNPSLSLKWVLPTFVDGRVRKSAEILSQLQERYGEKVAPPIKYSVKLSEATAFGKTIFEHEPKGPGAEGYRRLAERVLRDAPAWPLAAAEAFEPGSQLQAGLLPKETVVPLAVKPEEKIRPPSFPSRPEPVPDPGETAGDEPHPLSLRERLKRNPGRRGAVWDRLKNTESPSSPAVDPQIKEVRERLYRDGKTEAAS